MKKHFITGLVILLPLALTILLVVFVFNLLTSTFVDGVSAVFDYYGIFEKGFLFLSGKQLNRFVSRLLILILLVLFTVLLGFVGRWYFVHSTIKFWEGMVLKIPFIRSVYKTCKDVMSTIMETKTRSFKQVVMVHFPNEQTQTIGLVTQENIPSSDGEEMLAVFVPTTPNPTSGFLMMFKDSDLVHLDMSIEDAFKYIISCGVIPSPFKKVEASK